MGPHRGCPGRPRIACGQGRTEAKTGQEQGINKHSGHCRKKRAAASPFTRMGMRLRAKAAGGRVRTWASAIVVRPRLWGSSEERRGGI